MGAKGKPLVSKMAESSAALWLASLARSSGNKVDRTRTRSLLVANSGLDSMSVKPSAWQKVVHCASLTAARNICSPSFTVKTSYKAQAEIRSGMGAAATPVMAYRPAERRGGKEWLRTDR